MLPPWASTMILDWNKPMPRPSLFVETDEKVSLSGIHDSFRNHCPTPRERLEYLAERPNPDLPPVFHCISGVKEQIGHDLLKPLRIREYSWHRMKLPD